MVFNHVVSTVHPKTALFVQFHIMKSTDQGAHRGEVWIGGGIMLHSNNMSNHG